MSESVFLALLSTIGVKLLTYAEKLAFYSSDGFYRLFPDGFLLNAYELYYLCKTSSDSLFPTEANLLD